MNNQKPASNVQSRYNKHFTHSERRIPHSVQNNPLKSHYSALKQGTVVPKKNINSLQSEYMDRSHFNTFFKGNFSENEQYRTNHSNLSRNVGNGFRSLKNNNPLSFNLKNVKKDHNWNRPANTNPSLHLDNTISQIVDNIDSNMKKKDKVPEQVHIPVIVPQRKFINNTQVSFESQQTDPRTMGKKRIPQPVDDYSKILEKYNKKEKRISVPSQILDKSFRANEKQFNKQNISRNKSYQNNRDIDASIQRTPFIGQKIIKDRREIESQHNYSYLPQKKFEIENNKVFSYRQQKTKEMPGVLDELEKPNKPRKPKVIEKIDLSNIFLLGFEVLAVTLNVLIQLINGLLNSKKRGKRETKKPDVDKQIKLLLPFDYDVEMDDKKFESLKYITATVVCIAIYP